MGRLSLVTVALGATLLFGTLVHAQQQASSPPPPPPPAYGAPITLEQARAAIAAGEAESKKNGWNHVSPLSTAVAILLHLRKPTSLATLLAK